MGVLSVDELKADMLVAQDVLNKHGKLMLGKGSKLTKKNIMLFKAWGVIEVDVKGVDQAQVDQEEIKTLSDENIASIEEELKELFPNLQDNPLMNEIARIVKKFKIRDMIEKINGGEHAI